MISFENLKSAAAMKKMLMGISSIVLMAACAKTISPVKVAEEPMVQDCAYVATLSETSDPGRKLDNLRPPEHQDEVLERAANLGATHIVWVYDFRIGSAAVAYRCDH